MRRTLTTTTLLTLSLALGACTGGSPAASSLEPSAGPTPTQDPLAGVPIVTVPVEWVEMGSPVGYMAVGGGYLWAATGGGLARINPTDLSITMVDDISRFAMAATDDSIWASSAGGTVTRYDPETLEATVTVAVEAYPDAIAIQGDATWVAQHRGGSVTRLAEPSGEIVTEVEVGPDGRSGPHGVAVDATSLWVGLPNNRTVVRVDTATNAVVATIKVPTSPCGGIAIQPDAIWVSSCYDTRFALRIDPGTNTVVAAINIGGFNGGAMLIDGGVWIPTDIGLVLVDRESNAIGRLVTFSDDYFPAFGSAVGFGSVWLGAEDGRIARIALSDLAD